MHFIYPPGMCFTQKYDHIRLQGRPYEKEFKLFLNTKINATKVGTEKEDENMESVSILLYIWSLKCQKSFFFSNFVLTWS